MKKGRVRDMTRPQPTIYGNCDSWDFIVGKNTLAEPSHTPPHCRCNAATKNYQQFINTMIGTTLGQVGRRLWTVGG
jgi:hypothetical protein